MCDYLPPSAAELLVSLARESEQLKIKIGQLEKDNAALKAKLSELEKSPNIRSRFLFYHARGIKAIP